MRRRSITIFLSIALIASFFIPYYNWDSFSLSGLDFVLSTHTPGLKYLLLLIPLSGILLLLEALSDDRYLINKQWLMKIPLIVSITMAFVIYFNMNSKAMPFERISYLQILGWGFWLIMIISLLLAFMTIKSVKKALRVSNKNS